MKNKLMLGLWRYIINVPPILWQKQIAQGKRKFEKVHGTLSEEKRLIHHFVVKQLPYSGNPLTPKIISHQLGFPVDRVKSALDDLEKRMTFLYRNVEGDVVWAYPVTVDQTPHKITFNTGEKLYAA
ncbi:MAG: hypothetical protein HKO79_12970 [Desulfobacterales bacterium]|nr:hypothetical protein [Desulfobacterales bacterium]